MAEGILLKTVSETQKNDCKVSSMGIHGLDSQPASKNSVLACSEKNIDISAHRSRPLIPGELVKADLIFTMELVHKDFLKLFFPAVADKTFLLGSWPQKETKKGNIKDPIGRPLKDYRKAFDQIEKQIQRVFPYVVHYLP